MPRTLPLDGVTTSIDEPVSLKLERVSWSPIAPIANVLRFDAYGS
jgi:hypothetical protein